MPPADPDSSSAAEDAEGAGHEGDAVLGERRPRQLRCERCLDVLSTRHAWDSASCRCGELTLTGPPWAPKVRWTSSPGGGWSEVEDPDPGRSPSAEFRAPVIGYVR